MQDVSIWADLLKSVGFPIAIAVYLLFRFEKKIDGLTKSIEKLEGIVQNNKKGEMHDE